MNNLPIIILKHFIITVVFEILFAIILKTKNKKDFLNIFLVNLLTNPLFNISIILIIIFFGTKCYYYSIVLLEIIIVLVEAKIYQKTLTYKKMNLYLFSLILNTASYFGGLLINRIGWL